MYITNLFTLKRLQLQENSEYLEKLKDMANNITFPNTHSCPSVSPNSFTASRLGGTLTEILKRLLYLLGGEVDADVGRDERRVQPVIVLVAVDGVGP